MNEQHRTRARVERVTFHIEDHGFWTCWLHLALLDAKLGEWGSQGFGGLALSEGVQMLPQDQTPPTTLALAYVADVCAALGIPSRGIIDHKSALAHLEQAVGREVFALRSFGEWNEEIEGIEVVKTGMRFTHSRFRLAHLPGATPTNKLEEYIQRRASTIASLERRIGDERRAIATAHERFVDWEKPAKRAKR